MIGVYIFNKIQLRKRVVPVQQPRTSTQQIVEFKTLISGVISLFLVVIGILTIQAQVFQGEIFPYAPFLICLVCTFIICYFSMKSYIREYSALQIRKETEMFKLLIEQYNTRRKGADSVVQSDTKSVKKIRMKKRSAIVSPHSVSAV